jgi:hypothetical protein
MPGNYMNLGLLHLAFPEAAMIHIQRNPVDSCLSIFATHNQARIAWAHHKSGIVEAYHRYEAMIEFWRKTLPPGRFLEVRYEQLVESPEEMTRRIIAHCGLDWDPACLTPEKNDRGVHTPSLCQVRKPIYKSSLSRAEKFKPWLGPLAEISVDRAKAPAP